MARNTGDRTCVRNVNISSAGVGNTQAHNEREKKTEEQKRQRRIQRQKCSVEAR